MFVVQFANEKLNMQTVEEFLAYSIHLEQEAATRFGQLADAMEFVWQWRSGKALSPLVGLFQIASC